MMGTVEKREASDLSKRVAAELKADQGRRGWTARDLERKSPMSYTTIGRLLNGKTEISVEDLFVICEAIGADVHAIVKEAESHMPEGYLERLVSPAPDNVTPLHERDWDTYEGRKAADDDAEAETDEPDNP
jgi:transcriptional regulator with XRE-family HTH domain